MDKRRRQRCGSTDAELGERAALMSFWRGNCRLRRRCRQAVRTHQEAQDPRRVPRVLSLPAITASTRGADRDRVGQLESAPVNKERYPRG